jgi:hypothetical protein
LLPLRDRFGEFAWTPTLEVVQKNQHLVARFELPGLKKEEIAARAPSPKNSARRGKTPHSPAAIAYPAEID